MHYFNIYSKNCGPTQQ